MGMMKRSETIRKRGPIQSAGRKEENSMSSEESCLENRQRKMKK
jgi:hypothetical protein